MKALILHQNNLMDIKIKQFCQSTAELLKRIHQKHATIGIGKTLKRSKKGNK